jgi:hypothetical protein
LVSRATLNSLSFVISQWCHIREQSTTAVK